MKKLIIIFFILFNIFSAQSNFDDNVLPKFNIDIINRQKNNNETLLDVFIQIPYSNLRFVKNDNIYSSHFNIELVFIDETTNNVLQNISWVEEVKTKNTEQTNSVSSFKLSLKKISIPPGTYRIVCNLEDLESHKVASFDSKFTVRNFNSTLYASDILLINTDPDYHVKNKLLPNISRIIPYGNKVIKGFYEIYSLTDTTLNVKYLIQKNNKKILAEIESKLDIKKGKNNFIPVIPDTGLQLGKYTLKAIITTLNNKTVAVIRKSFKYVIGDFAIPIDSLDTAIRQMEFITNADEQEYLLNAPTYSEKVNRFLAFWKSKDPTPETTYNEVLIEYFRRVQFANNTFTGYKEGWRSDMGMIYITLGPPDEVERHPMDGANYPYEVWSYSRINRAFVFIDRTGFGDYKLQNTNYYDWSKFRM